MPDRIKVSSERAQIFRITHIDNVPWLLRHGLHCPSSDTLDPNFVQIGAPQIIGHREQWPVPAGPGGVLSDYVPFHFTPSSIMLLNILTGRWGAKQRQKGEIVVLVASLRQIEEEGHAFVFTDGHAMRRTTQYFTTLDELDQVDWDILRARDFSHDEYDMGKKDRYMAEALIHQHLPASLLVGIACYSENEERTLRNLDEVADLDLKIAARPNWYFPG